MTELVEGAPLAAPRASPWSVADDPHWIAERALTVARRTALGVLGDPVAADDVAQDVAVIALRHATKIRDSRLTDGWLHKVAVRAALKEARSQRRRQTVPLSAGVEPGAEDHREGLDHAIALLDRLPPRQRAALTLRYVHDLPDEAIATAIGCRQSTVRSLLRRGRTALRERLTDLEETR